MSLCDLAPTILGLAGAEPLEAVDGKSLVRTVQGAAEKLRGHLLAFRYEEICYKSDIDRFGKDGPAYRNKLKEMGWVGRPDHAVAGTMSRRMDKHCIYDGRYAYLFNASFFEDQPIQAYPYGTKALDVMVEAAEAGDTEIAKRVAFFTYRSKEEFYDWDRDPGLCSNLIADADYRSCIQDLKAALKRCMVASGDPVAGKI